MTKAETKALDASFDFRPVDIFIVGTGIVPGAHLTRETEAAVRNSNEVLYVDKSFGIEELLKAIGAKKVTDLHAASYREGDSRLDAYRKMAAMVVEAALAHGPVVFALYGHPLVYALPPFFVIAAGEAVGLNVKTLAAVSSLDTMFVDLRVDPCTQGVQMYEATDLLLRQRPIQPDVPCFIWQIGTVGTRIYSEHASKPERFSAIRDYLAQYYPLDHEMVAVYSPNLPLAPAMLTRFTLKTIESVADQLHQGVTVFIPSVEFRPVNSDAMLDEIDDLGRLRELTVA
ncbi:MAG: hypothetical protein H7Y20_00725 [Bryobacteraceae bacterium]|nr:hypothetical protein [Bryobacteraceae bacterium]